MAVLSSRIQYLNDKIGASAALDIAVLSYYILSHLGLTYGALICESEDVNPKILTSILIDSLSSDTEELKNFGNCLEQNEFSSPGASVNVYSNILDKILTYANKKNLNDRIPKFANQIFKDGIKHGLANEEVVSLIKLLRN